MQGHEGKLIFGTMGERAVPVVLLVGRAQYVATYIKPNPKHPNQALISVISASTKATPWTS